jgi:hypothetical protein
MGTEATRLPRRKRCTVPSGQPADRPHLVVSHTDRPPRQRKTVVANLKAPAPVN